jgi:cytochrome c oxidase subunit II
MGGMYGRWRGRHLKAAILAVLAVLASAWLTGCPSPTSTLDPRGPGAALIADLWWLMFWLSLAVFIAVMGFLFYALYRARSGAETPPPIGDMTLIVGGGIVIPAIILFTLLVVTVRTGSALSPERTPAALTVEVTGHQFWWEIHYPQYGVTTANEIHIPVGLPVLIELRSADVIHSLWVPQLQGKLDLVPGQTNRLTLQAGEPGVFRGLCAEYCGLQHTLMHFLVVAESPDQFDAWITRQQQPAPPPGTSLVQQGRQVYFAAGCAACHAIRGTDDRGSRGSVGPDLTHLASRRTLAAAILENTRANLAQWILDPDSIKPGNRMPATRLDGQSLDALLAYLESLR